MNFQNKLTQKTMKKNTHKQRVATISEDIIREKLKDRNTIAIFNLLAKQENERIKNELNKQK